MAEFIAGSWEDIFKRDVSHAVGEICLLVPFVSGRGAELLLQNLQGPSQIRMVTRLNDEDFLRGVSDIDALIELRDHDVRLRFQNRRLHAKMYLFGSRSVVVTSGNLSKAGIQDNAEIGVRLTEKQDIRSARDHFDRVWDSLQADSTRSQLEDVRNHIIELQLASQGREILPKGVEDHGCKAYSGHRPHTRHVPTTAHRAGESSGQHFCKFLWKRNDPAPIETIVRDIASGQGAVAFPLHPGRPNQIHLHDHIYHTALTFSELGSDWRVFGRARVAIPHRPGVDEIPANLREVIPGLRQYPYCVWLCDCEFIDGTIGDGVSLHDLFNALGDNTFEWSKAKAEQGDPGRHIEAIRYYRSHIALTSEGADFLNSVFDHRVSRFGKITIKSGSDIWWNNLIRDYDSKCIFIKRI